MTTSYWHATAEYPLYAPGGIYLRNLHRGRVCYDHRGTKMKILDVGECSISVRYSGGTLKVIGAKSFKAPNTPVALAPDTVVYLVPGGGPVLAPGPEVGP